MKFHVDFFEARPTQHSHSINANHRPMHAHCRHYRRHSLHWSKIPPWIHSPYPSLDRYLVSSFINSMRAISFISAVVMLASSASASNDPRECEGECGRVRPMPSMAMRDEILDLASHHHTNLTSCSFYLSSHLTSMNAPNLLTIYRIPISLHESHARSSRYSFQRCSKGQTQN